MEQEVQEAVDKVNKEVNKGTWVMYDSWSGTNLYTKDSKMLYIMKKYNFYRKIMITFLTIGTLALFAGLMLLVLTESPATRNLGCILSSSFIIFSIVNFLLTGLVSPACNEDVYHLFKQTDEAQEQIKCAEEKRAEEIRLKEEGRRRKKATQITNVYHTLDSHLSKENKIEKIMEWLKDDAENNE